MPDLIRRWEMLTTLLRNQIKGNVDNLVADMTRERIRRLALDTDRRLVQLPKPDFEDVCFKGLRFGHPGRSRMADLEDRDPDKRLAKKQGALYLDHVKLPLLTDPVQIARAVLELERLHLNSKKRTKEYAIALTTMRKHHGKALAARAEGREYAPPGSPTPMRRIYCLDGCGRKAGIVRDSGGRPLRPFRFIRGHQVKYIKKISMVERGFARWEDLPVIMKEGVPWGTCIKCKGPIPLVDPHGKELELPLQIGIACWRQRLHTWWPYKEKKAPKRGRGPNRPKVDPFNDSV